MVRPKKPAAQVKVTDLRIPVTQGQKAIIKQASEILERDMADWVRELVVRQAETIISVHIDRARTEEKS